MIILYLILAHIIKNSLRYRGDPIPTLPLYHYDTWDNLDRKPFTFKSGKWNLNGFSYWKKGNKSFKAVVTFFHGIGSGHYAYMSFINLLANDGYLVYAYDNRGSLLSEGDYLNNLSEAAKNQTDFFKYLDGVEEVKNLPRYSIGHSWGGYAALCSLRKEFNVEKVISLSGFDSPIRIYTSAVKATKPLSFLMKLYQKIHYGNEGNISGLKLMKETDKKVLYIQGDQDKMVDYEHHGKLFQEELKDKPNIEFMIREGYGHNPYWAKEAEAYYKSLANPKTGVVSFDRDLDLKINHEYLRSIEKVVADKIIDFFNN